MVKKSYMSSAKMRVLKPKLEEATKQYDKPEDQMKKQQEMMSLYSKYGVSPLSGCLPMLIQMPIWIAMFNFVPNAIQLRRESFLWIEDLSTYDPIISWQTNIWGIGDHLSLTCILFCVSNVLYSYMTMRQQKDQMVGQHDVSDARHVLLHVQRLLVGPQLLLFHLTVLLCRHYVDTAQDHQRREAACHLGGQLSEKQEQPHEEDLWPRRPSRSYAEAGRRAAETKNESTKEIKNEN